MPAISDLPCACATSRQFARALTQFYDARLSPAGVDAPQFALLMSLAAEGALSQIELSRRHLLDKTTVSRNLAVLERKAWIQPAPSTDKRQRRFTLTADGRKVFARAKSRWQRAQDEVRSTLGQSQWDALFQLLRTGMKDVSKLSIALGRY